MTWWTMREEGDMVDHEGAVREEGDMVDHVNIYPPMLCGLCRISPSELYEGIHLLHNYYLGLLLP